MTAHSFLFTTVLTRERLSWLDQAFKYYYQEKTGSLPVSAPGSAGSGALPNCTIFLTGDALYSLNEAESRHIWGSVLSFSRVRLTCDRDALELRGIDLAPLKERFPDRVSDLPGEGHEGGPSFWAAAISASLDGCMQDPPQIGWLQVSSPYMFPAAGYGIRCLSSALELGCGVSLYACLDGCHTCHTCQNPGARENTGEAIETLAKHAAEKSLPCSVMMSRYSASARGYQSWDDGQGTIGSTFIVRSARIRDPEAMIRHSRTISSLFSENVGCVRGPLPEEPPSRDSPRAPPVVVLITKSPYSTGYAYGGIALAAACAHQGIRARVVFLEDGIFALTGEHRAPREFLSETFPGLIGRLAANENLEFFALTPSFHQRGLVKNGSLAAVKEIGFEEIGPLLFVPPGEAGNGSQRILFF